MAQLTDDKPMWGVGEVLGMALPVAAGMVGNTVMQFIDGLMVANLVGYDALSAHFVSAILSFLPAAVAMGTLSVVNTFVSQNLGAGRGRRCGQYAWHGLYLAVLLALLALPLAAVGPKLFAGLSALIARWGGQAAAPKELALQTMYFRYMIVGMPLMLMGRSMGQFFFGIHRPWVVMVIILLAVGVNVGANYVLITGAGPFPPLGLEGAAIGTIIAWAFGLVLALGWFLRGEYDRQFRTRSGWRFRVRFCRDILRVGWPAGMHFGLDIMAWSIFNSVLVAYFGPIHKAASAAAVRYMHVSFMPTVGIGIACTALVGRYIGRGRPDLARRRARASVGIAVVYMGLCGVAFWLFRYPLIETFIRWQVGGPGVAHGAAVQDEIIRIGSMVLICAAVFQCFDAVGIVFAGALRGAGDTFWPMVITFVMAWTIIVGGGAAMIRWLPQLQSIGPWVAASVYVIILGMVMAWRFECGAWQRIDLLGRRTGTRAPAAPAAPAAETVPGPAAAGAQRAEHGK
ncbi:MAG: MATE family efflux transporter [Planctomycetota bacterium]|jgi:MATE family multidrug resistance protein